MTRITVINPNTSAELTDAIVLAAREVSGSGVTVRGVHPADGVPSVESHAEEAIAAVGVLAQVREQQADTDAYVVACFGDTGVQAAREVASCPVVGMTEAALQTACLIAHRFVVVTLPARTAMAEDGAEAVVLGCAGLADLVGPLSRALDIPVVDGVAAAVGIATGLVAMGLNTSRANTFAAVELP